MLTFLISLSQKVILFSFFYVLVDILDSVIVLFQSGAFRVCDVTRICFGLCSRLCYRVVSERYFRMHVIYTYFLFDVLELTIVLYQNRVFEHRFGGPKTKYIVVNYSDFARKKKNIENNGE